MSMHSIPQEHVDQTLDKRELDYTEKYITISGLPRVKADILRAEMTQYMSESPSMSAQQIADHLDCSVESVYQAHKDVRFIKAKDQILTMWYQNQQDKVYKAVIQTAIDGKVGAQRLYLESTNRTSKRIETRNMNLNADIMGDQGLDLDSAIDKFLIMIGNRGWSIEMVADRWRSLKNSQAF